MRSATQSTESKIAVYTLRVERERLERLRAIAVREHRTVSEQLRYMIDRRIAEGEDRSADECRETMA